MEITLEGLFLYIKKHGMAFHVSERDFINITKSWIKNLKPLDDMNALDLADRFESNIADWLQEYNYDFYESFTNSDWDKLCDNIKIVADKIIKEKLWEK